MALSDFGLSADAMKRGAGLTRDAALAQNAYSRFLSQDRGTRNIANLNRGMTQGLDRFGGGFARRGLANSGIYNQAQSDYASNWQRQLDAINQQMLNENNQYNLRDAQAWMQYDATTGNADESKYNDILNTAYGLQRATGV